MQMALRWLASASSSCLHAAAAMLRGQRPADEELAAALAEPVRLLASEVSAAGLPQQPLLSHLVPLSSDIDNNRQLADTALVKVVGRGRTNESTVAGLAGAIGEVEKAFVGCRPNVIHELELRGRVLREQWESRGRGLIAAESRLTDEGLIPSQADVVLVHPFLGGGGDAHLPYNRVTIEAVLANPHADLPEVLRLGWMLAMLNLEVPLYSETVHRDRLHIVGPLAMLPVALVAGEQVDLCRYGEETIRRAITCWRLDVDEPVTAADAVARWWTTYLAAKPKWPVALAALDQMLASTDPGGA